MLGSDGVLLSGGTFGSVAVLSDGLDGVSDELAEEADEEAAEDALLD